MSMTEEQVTRSVLQWLTDLGWDILDYDFPGGGTGRSFHIDDCVDKTEGIVIPDVIAFKDGVILLFEDKSVDTWTDYEKVERIAKTVKFLDLLRAAYPDKEICNIRWGIAYSGARRFIDRVKDTCIDFVVNVMPDSKCEVVFGDLGLL